MEKLNQNLSGQQNSFMTYWQIIWGRYPCQIKAVYTGNKLEITLWLLSWIYNKVFEFFFELFLFLIFEDYRRHESEIAEHLYCTDIIVKISKQLSFQLHYHLLSSRFLPSINSTLF